MSEIIRETVSTNVPSSNSVQTVRTTKREPTDSYTVQNLIYFIFGSLDVLLLFRFVFKLMGANPGSGFVSFIYGITAPFVLPFQGIFRSPVTQGVETTSVLEAATLVAIPVYMILAWGLVKLIAILTKEPEV